MSTARGLLVKLAYCLRRNSDTAVRRGPEEPLTEVVKHGLHEIFVARRVNNSVAALIPLQRHIETFCSSLFQLCLLQLPGEYV